MHAGGLGTGERGGEVEHAGEALVRAIAGAPARLARALGIGVAQLHVVELRLDALALQAPARVGLQAIQRQTRFLEHIGQFERAIADADARAAALVAEVEVHRGAADAGPSGQRVAPGVRHAPAGLARKRQAHNAPAGLVTAVGQIKPPFGGRPGTRAPLPARVQAIDLPGGAQLFDQPMTGCGQGQAAGDGRERGQVEALGIELQTGASALACHGVRQAQAGGRPGHALGCAKRQVLGRQLIAIAGPGGGQPALQVVDGEHRQLGTQLRLHALQSKISRDAGQLPVEHISPGAQSPLSRAHFHPPVREVHIGAQAFHVDMGEVGEHLAVPAVPGVLACAIAVQIEQGFAQATAQAQAFAPRWRRRGIHTKLVRERGVARHEVQVLQRQRRLVPQVVGPAQRATLNDKFALGKKPVGTPGVALARTGQVQAGDLDAALRGAPHIEHRAVDHDLLETAAPEGARRERGADERQLQGHAALGVDELHVAQLERGHQRGQPGTPVLAVAGPYFTHPNRNSHRRAGPPFQVGAPFADSGHNPRVQAEPGQRKQAPARQNQPQHESGCQRNCLEGSRGSSDGSRSLIHVHRKL